jgi:hypothetical protein
LCKPRHVFTSPEKARSNGVKGQSYCLLPGGAVEQLACERGEAPATSATSSRRECEPWKRECPAPRGTEGGALRRGRGSENACGAFHNGIAIHGGVGMRLGHRLVSATTPLKIDARGRTGSLVAFKRQPLRFAARARFERARHFLRIHRMICVGSVDPSSCLADLV